jgi:hypothetical protein
MVVPVLVGSGRALFSGLPHQVDLGPAELTRFGDGTFAVKYLVSPERSRRGRTSP